MRTEGNGKRKRLAHDTVRQGARESRAVSKGGSWGLRIDNIIPVILCVLLIVYLAFYFVNYLGREEPHVVPVVYGSVDVPLVHRGIIVRDEKVYTNFRDGVVFYLVNDKARVKKDAVICEVYDEATVMGIEEKLSAVEKSILSEQSGQADSDFNEEITAANEILKADINAGMSNISPVDLRPMYQLQRRLRQTLDVRNNLLLASDTDDVRGSTRERDKYLGQLQEAKSVISAESSGIVSYNIDGLEELLSVAGRTGIAKEIIMNSEQGFLLGGETAALENAGAFKLIGSNEWYIVAYIENEVADTLTEDYGATLYITEGDSYEPLEMEVESIAKGDTESYVVFKSDKLMLDYLDRRTLSFKINLNVTQGYKIPNSAIAERTLLRIPKSFITEQMLGRFGEPVEVVTKRGSSEPMLIEVNAVRTDDVYSYVLQEDGGLMLGDTLTAESGAEHVIEGFETVKGVYIMNAGIRTFCMINISGDVAANSGYTVIDPKLNKGLNLDDSILSDVSGDLG